MWKQNISRSFFTTDGEFLDEFKLTELESELGDSQKTLSEIQTHEGLPEIAIDTDDLDAHYQKCRQNPANPHTLQIAEGTYETQDQFETFKGDVIAYINCWYETKPQESHPEPNVEQLTLF